MAVWQYDPVSRRYRNARGRYLDPTTMVEIRDDFVDRSRRVVDDLAGDLAEGRMGLAAWERRMRAEVKTAYLGEYAFGRGGRHAMTRADVDAVGRMVEDQYGYLHGFAQALADGALTEAQLAARAALYVNGSRTAYERARASAHEVTLPHYPGDGSTPCRVNCRCTWRLERDDDAVRATWVMGGAEHCDTCAERAVLYAPLVIPLVGAELVTAAADR